MSNLSLDSFKLLTDLINSPSPSGYEQPAQAVFREYCSQFADKIETDVLGNTYAILNEPGGLRVMLAGHADEIGFVVTHITSAGFIYFDPIGGHDPVITLGQRVLVHNAKKNAIPGVICRKPIHMQSPDERGKKTDLNELFIDIGVHDGVSVSEIVSVSDPITYAAGFQPLIGDLATSHGFDNKAGQYVVAEALRLIKERGGCSSAVYAVSTVQEEVGQRGAKTAAFRINPQVGIAVDVGHATDYPGTDKRHIGDIKIGGGPIITRGANVNPEVYRRLIAAAESEGVRYQLVARPGAIRTDIGIMQLNNGGMATGALGIPLRYMHTPGELVSLHDIADTAKLLARFVIDLDSDTDFTPKD